MRVKTDVLGVLYDNVTMQEALERGRALLEADAPAYCVTPNAEMAYEALHDEAFRAVLNGAALVLPEEGLDGKRLFTEAAALLRDETRLAAMHEASLRLGVRDATERIYETVMALVK